MSNDFWKELKRLVKRAEKASGGNVATEHAVAYAAMQQHVNDHSPIAPQPPEVVVSDEMAKKAMHHYHHNPVRNSNSEHGRDMIAAVQSILGPTLGLVSREDVARMVEAAYREGQDNPRDHCTNSYDAWARSIARKRLESGR